MLNFLNTLGRTIKDNWALSILFLLLLPILLRLGYWQLERAVEKQILIESYHKQLSQPAVSVASLPTAQRVTYRTVTAQGIFDPRYYWLLDNRPRNGRTGYEVVMPLVTSDGIILVNRGWLPASSMRNQLPVIETPNQLVTLSGHLYAPQKNAVIKHSQSDLVLEWPKRVIQLDLEEAEQLLGQEVAPLLLRVDDGVAGAFTTQWSMINVSVEKHRGYALQWFSMGIALLLLYFWVMIKSFRECARLHP